MVDDGVVGSVVFDGARGRGDIAQGITVLYPVLSRIARDEVGAGRRSSLRV